MGQIKDPAPQSAPPPTAPAAAVHTKTVFATLNGNEGKRSPAAIAHTKTISTIVNSNEGKMPAAAGQGGEIGAAEQRAAEWGLILKTDDETGKPQGVKVRTSGDDLNAKIPGAGTSRRNSGNSDNLSH